LIKTAAAVSRLMNDQRPEALRVTGAMVGWRAQDQLVIKVGNGRVKFILEKISFFSPFSLSLSLSLSHLFLFAGERRYVGATIFSGKTHRKTPKNQNFLQ
jgi:hypothetical protein